MTEYNGPERRVEDSNELVHKVAKADHTLRMLAFALGGFVLAALITITLLMWSTLDRVTDIQETQLRTIILELNEAAEKQQEQVRLQESARDKFRKDVDAILEALSIKVEELSQTSIREHLAVATPVPRPQQPVPAPEPRPPQVFKPEPAAPPPPQQARPAPPPKPQVAKPAPKPKPPQAKPAPKQVKPKAQAKPKPKGHQKPHPGKGKAKGKNKDK